MKGSVLILAIVVVLVKYEVMAESEPKVTPWSSCRPLDCGRISGKLCCNGKMYPNLCALNDAACAAGNVPLNKYCSGMYTHVDHKDPNPDQCSKGTPQGGTSCNPMDCGHNIGKVCCNGKAYQNLCALNKAACDAGILSLEKYCMGPHADY